MSLSDIYLLLDKFVANPNEDFSEVHADGLNVNEKPTK